jgi:positive regulator of sigma E activity
MEEIGKVIKTNKNRATVLIAFPDSCDSCEFASFCRKDKKGKEVVCKNDIDANIGDIVVLDTKGRNVVLAIGLNFILPLFFLIGGILLGKKIWGTDLAGFLLGMGLMFLYFFVFLFVDKKILKSGSLLPEIVKIKKRAR